MQLSIIIPCFNEEESLFVLYDAVKKVTQALRPIATEIIFVDDGSKDKTLDSIKKIAYDNKLVRYVSFSRNFGKESAMLAGLRVSNGDAVIIMDADLQHPPTIIEQMVEQWQNGYDQVIATRTRTGDKKGKSILSKLYYKLVNGLTDVEMRDGAGDFRLLSRQVVDTLLAMPEYNRFSKGLFSWVGYSKYYLPYENVTRIAGQSKFSIKKLFNYGIQGVLSFNDKPLRLCINLGLMLLSVCLVYIIAMVIEFFTKGVSSSGYFTTMTAILLIGGVQLLSIGVLGEYIGKIYYEVKKRPHYVVKESNVDKDK